MDKILLILLTLTIGQSFGQAKNNRHDRLTKDEFQELIKCKDNFIPTDLGDTIIIIKYSGQRLEQMQNRARSSSFAKNGTDTTGLTNESWLTEKQLQKNRQSMEKFALDNPLGLKKELKRKGIQSIIVDESELTKNKSHSKNEYWLKTTFISTQKSLDDNGWIMTTTNLFYDPRTDKDFEIFLPLNYSLLDLVK